MKGPVSLRGKKISIGPIGSGSRMPISRTTSRRNGIDDQVSELLDLAPQPPAEKLLAGEIDVALILNSWDSTIVQRLVGDGEHRGFPWCAESSAAGVVAEAGAEPQPHPQAAQIVRVRAVARDHHGPGPPAAGFAQQRNRQKSKHGARQYLPRPGANCRP